MTQQVNEAKAAPQGDFEEAYRGIVEFYDRADALIDTVSDDSAKFRDQQMDVVEPLVEEIIDAADELSAEFCEFADAADRRKGAKKFNFKKSFKKIFKAVNDTLAHLQSEQAEVAENIVILLQPQLTDLVKHAEAVFKKISILVDRALAVIQERSEEFKEMIMREAHVANLLQVQKQAATLATPAKSGGFGWFR